MQLLFAGGSMLLLCYSYQPFWFLRFNH